MEDVGMGEASKRVVAVPLCLDTSSVRVRRKASRNNSLGHSLYSFFAGTGKNTTNRGT
jgi:hypothetical protein